MTPELSYLLSLSVFIAGIIAIIRIRNINEVYYPFLYFIWIACINESLSIILSRAQIPVTINNNIYVLIESLLLLWFFKNILFPNGTRGFYLGLIMYIIIWFFENILLDKINDISAYFRITYSF